MIPKGEQRGLTYIEILVSLLLVIILVFAINVLLTGRRLQKETKARALAHQLAQEEMEVILNKNFDTLTATATAPFVDILFHRGKPYIVNDAAALSVPNVLDIESDADETGTVTGQAVLPKNNYSDFTLDTEMMVRSDSPPTGGGGFFFRARDQRNGYLLTINNTAITLDKIENGVVTNLATVANFIVYDNWEQYELIVTGNTIELRVNTILQFSVTDPASTEGYLALAATNQGHIAFDNLSVTDTSGTAVWNFDSNTKGNLTGEWNRQSPADLPSGQGDITIADYLGDSDIKQITVRVQWKDSGQTKTVELQTLKTK